MGGKLFGGGEEQEEMKRVEEVEEKKLIFHNEKERARALLDTLERMDNKKVYELE